MLAAIDWEGGFERAWESVITFVPKLLGFLVIIAIGYLIAKALATLVDKLLGRVGFDRWVERGALKPALDRTRFDASDIMGKLAFWLVFLLAVQLVHGDAQPLARELGHQLAEALALIEAQQVVGGDPDVVEEQLGGVGCILAQLFQPAAAPEALRLLGLDHQQRDALGAEARVGLGGHDDKVGVLTRGDEGLGPVYPVAVAVLPGRGLDVLQVRARRGLAHGHGGHQFAAAQARQPSTFCKIEPHPHRMQNGAA